MPKIALLENDFREKYKQRIVTESKDEMENKIIRKRGKHFISAINNMQMKSLKNKIE
jgi:hypothetical protein